MPIGEVFFSYRHQIVSVVALSGAPQLSSAKAGLAKSKLAPGMICAGQVGRKGMVKERWLDIV